MARVKRAVNAQKKRREVLELASGYRGQRSRLYRKAKEQVTHSLGYAFRDRRARKGDFRRLWIQRINAAARANGMTYNRFIQGLKAAGVEVDRRMLAELAVNDAAAFATLVELARANCLHAASLAGTDEFPRAAAAARLSATEAYDTAARDGVQIHGGIGVTWEHGLHLHMRRARSLAIECGNMFAWEDLLARELTGVAA